MELQKGNIENLFYQLLRMALGRQVCLPHTPNEQEWKALYELAKKQSLIGVCFAESVKVSFIFRLPVAAYSSVLFF